MDNHDFDMQRAERTLMDAQHIIGGTAPQRAARRLAMYPAVVAEFDAALTEVKRLAITHASAAQDALDQIQAIFHAEILEAIKRYGGVVKALDALREKVKMKSINDGPYLWQSIEEKGFSEAFDKLVAARMALELHNIPEA